MEKSEDLSSKAHSDEQSNNETEVISSTSLVDRSESDVNHTILEIVDQEFQNLVLEEDRNQQQIENQNKSDGENVEVEVDETEKRETEEEDITVEKGEIGEGYVAEESENQQQVVKEKEKGKKPLYPVRPGETDCPFYLKTGSCGFGSNCKFNHPPKKKHKVKSSSVGSDDSGQSVEEKTENPKRVERVGHLECKYYLTPGGCKFGKACRYHHPQEKIVVEPPQEVNFLGLPMRQGERECPFYMRTGSCKFASNCRFHHPNPSAGGSDSSYDRSSSVPFHSSALQSVGAPWSIPRPPTDAVSYARPYMPPMLQSQVHSPLEWNGYRAPINPVYPPQGIVRPMMASSLNNSNKNANGYSHYVPQMPVEEYPERPGQKECQYYMNTGDCKYKSACKFHHPKTRIPKSSNPSPFSLPIRPDQAACSHFSRYGICKYGPGCKYDHTPSPNSIPSPVAPASGPYPYYPNAANFGGANIPDFRDGSKALVQQTL